MNLTSRIRQAFARRKAEKLARSERAQAVSEAVERLVDEVNPKIRAVTSYRRKMSGAVERTLDFSERMVGTLPPPILVSEATWNGDPLVNAFFTSIERLQQVYSRAQVVRDYFDRNPGADECYGLLSMQRQERTVLGVEMGDGVMKRDVKQTSVSFVDHRLVRVAATEIALRKEMEDRAFEAMTTYALESINDLIVSQKALEAREVMLDIQSRLATARQASLLPLFAGEEDQEQDTQAQHRQTGVALDEARTGRMTLDDYVDRINDVFAHPEKHVKIDSVSMRLSKMNIKLDSESSEQGQVLDLVEVSLGNLQRVVAITLFPRAELLPKQNFLKEPERHLR